MILMSSHPAGQADDNVTITTSAVRRKAIAHRLFRINRSVSGCSLIIRVLPRCDRPQNAPNFTLLVDDAAGANHAGSQDTPAR